MTATKINRLGDEARVEAERARAKGETEKLAKLERDLADWQAKLVEAEASVQPQQWAAILLSGGDQAAQAKVEAHAGQVAKCKAMSSALAVAIAGQKQIVADTRQGWADAIAEAAKPKLAQHARRLVAALEEVLHANHALLAHYGTVATHSEGLVSARPIGLNPRVLSPVKSALDVLQPTIANMFPES